MNLYFIRHGEPDYSTDSLTPAGHKQAKLLSNSIEELHLDEIHQSPMGRAVQTAFYSAEKLGITPVSEPWLHELCWGDMSGNAYSSASPWSVSDDFIQNIHEYPEGDAWKNHPRFKNDRLVEDIENHVKDFDNFLAGYGYVRQGQLYRIEKPNAKNIALICHGGITAAFAAHLLNMSFLEFITHTHIGFTSVTKIALGDKAGYNAARMMYFNDCRHLGER